MSNMQFIVTNESLVVIVDGLTKTVRKDAPNFRGLRDALKSGNWELARKNLTVELAVANWARDRFKTQNGRLTFNGEPVPDDFSRRVHQMVDKNESPEPLLKFYERLQKNPSFRSVKQLWGFLSHSGIPITPTGTFLAYKSVTRDYKDHHSKTFDNSPGHTIKMARNRISDDPDLACHEGFHVGAITYANSFGSGDRRIVICEVDPEHVVCVPKDESQRKMRVCEYTVIGNYGTDLPSTTFDPAEDLKGHEEDLDDDDEDENVESSSGFDNGSNDGENDDEESKEEELDLEDIEEQQQVLKESRKAKKTKTARPTKAERDGPKEGSRVSGRPTKMPAKFDKFEKMTVEQLLDCHLTDELRPYAAVGLRIIGASKIRGGKTALVAAIMETRKK